jgi:hypothetical protein
MNILQKLLLKMRGTENYRNVVYQQKLLQVQPPRLDRPADKDVYSFKHSGNAGDIIYALPVILALCNGKKADLHLQVDQPGHYGKNPHPLGNLMLTTKMVDMLTPLLQSQDYINSCSVYDPSTTIDFDLDIVRQYPWYMSRGDLCRHYFLAFAAYYDLQHAWLKVDPDTDYNDTIVIARSQRYNAPGIDYSFLQQYPKLVFIGIEVEYEIMKEKLPGLQFKKVNDFLHMARIIAGSRLFIGNQSFPYAIAEALKTNRLLEVYFQSPNVIPTGNSACDFCFQPQFEKLVKDKY